MKEHIVGTDSHDWLYVDDEKRIHYMNLQNGYENGSDLRSYGYGFVAESVSGYGKAIQLIRVDELLEMYLPEFGFSDEAAAEIKKAAAIIRDCYQQELDARWKKGDLL